MLWKEIVALGPVGSMLWGIFVLAITQVERRVKTGANTHSCIQMYNITCSNESGGAEHSAKAINDSPWLGPGSRANRRWIMLDNATT